MAFFRHEKAKKITPVMQAKIDMQQYPYLAFSPLSVLCRGLSSPCLSPFYAYRFFVFSLSAASFVGDSSPFSVYSLIIIEQEHQQQL